MIIKSSDVRAAVKAVWSKFKYMILFDPEWFLPDVAEVRQWVKELGVHNLPYFDHLFECEEYSLSLLVAVRRRQAEMAGAYRRKVLAQTGKLPDRGQWRNWPLGIVAGTRFQGETKGHVACICHTRQGLFLIEGQTGEFWQPNADEDAVYFLLM